MLIPQHLLDSYRISMGVGTPPMGHRITLKSLEILHGIESYIYLYFLMLLLSNYYSDQTMFRSENHL